MLFSYRITPQSTTGLSPAELLLGRKLRSTLDLAHPDLKRKVENRQEKLKENHNRCARGRHFGEGDTILTKNFGHGPNAIPGVIEAVTGPVSYRVILGDGRVSAGMWIYLKVPVRDPNETAA